MGKSLIIKHNFGPLYPIPQSTKSRQITAYQCGLQQISNRIFHNVTALAQWLLAQALFINMHEYFSGQIVFELHPACDTMYHIQNSSTTAPFQMRKVEENISVLDEYTSPTTLDVPSQNDRYTTNPFTVYVTNKQLELVDYITKFTGQFIHFLMNLPGNTALLRLITFNYKITINQSVQMLEAIYNYAIANQRGVIFHCCAKHFILFNRALLSLGFTI